MVVMEATYGDRLHKESPEDSVEAIEEAVGMIIRNGGTLLIPTFAIHRTQDVLNILKNLSLKMKEAKGKLGKMPIVFLDSPMAAEVTQVYNIQNHRGAKIIVAGSGMMSGGRIERHALRFLPYHNTVILFVGYPAEGTPSRAITSLEKRVSIGDGAVDVNATVLQTSGLSGHADQKKLVDWLTYIYGGEKTLRSVYLVHGSNESREGLARKINTEMNFYNVFLPNLNEKIELKSKNP